MNDLVGKTYGWSWDKFSMCEYVYEFGKQIWVRAGLRKKCASKLVCDLCISLVNKSEVGAGLKKSVRVS